MLECLKASIGYLSSSMGKVLQSCYSCRHSFEGTAVCVVSITPKQTANTRAREREVNNVVKHATKHHTKKTIPIGIT